MLNPNTGLTSNENTTTSSPVRGSATKRNSGGGADIKVTHHNNSRARPSPNVLAPPPAKRGRGRKVSLCSTFYNFLVHVWV